MVRNLMHFRTYVSYRPLLILEDQMGPSSEAEGLNSVSCFGSFFLPLSNGGGDNGSLSVLTACSAASS